MPDAPPLTPADRAIVEAAAKAGFEAAPACQVKFENAADWTKIERDRQMTSDVKPATDYEISGIKAAMPDHFYPRHRMLADMGLLLARIAADAARIRELEARQVPDGWQVVPKEPTVAMERSAVGRDTRDEGIASMYSGIYRAMLAAAPRP